MELFSLQGILDSIVAGEIVFGMNKFAKWFYNRVKVAYTSKKEKRTTKM